jgi:hypothetical protein
VIAQVIALIMISVFIRFFLRLGAADRAEKGQSCREANDVCGLVQIRQ